VCVRSSVPDPDPDPPDPHVVGPPGSGSINQRYGSGSGIGFRSFYHQVKIVRKTLTSFGILSLKKVISRKPPDPLVRGMDPRIRILTKMS
jgi:hypothetical protein